MSKPRELSRVGIVWVIITAIVGGILVDIKIAEAYKVEEVQAVTTIEKREVKLEVVYNWTPERIEKEIRDTFTETPNTAVAVAKAEGGLVVERQSDFYKDGTREPSFCAFQIHAPSWEKIAKSLGYGDYRKNPASCVKMAKYIYDNTGKNFNQWSAYRDGLHKKYL